MSAAAFLHATATNVPFEGSPGDGAEEVFARAFDAAVKLRFRRDVSLAAVTGSVRAAARRHRDLVPIREAEMMIRSALGEEVPTGEIERTEQVKVHVLLFAALVEELALTDQELDELISSVA